MEQQVHTQGLCDIFSKRSIMPFPVENTSINEDDRPNRDLKKTNTAHTWLSITVTEKGVYTSLYYHPLGNGPDDHNIRKTWF
jgi:hypothetical protein